MSKREIRFLAKAEVRAKADGNKVIQGYASMFNSLSQDLGGFKEVIRPGAFTQSLENGADVRALFNHDENMVLGRSTAGTLRLMEDNVGLRFEVDLPDTSYANDLYTSIKRGDIDQCSFGFYCMDENWLPMSDDPGVLREVLRAEVFDVSPVTFPAYQATSLSTRSLFPDGTDEIDKRKAQVAETLKQVAEKRAAKTKKVAGVELPSSSFAYVGDPDVTSTWKLPIFFPGDEAKTVEHIKNALARFADTKGIPQTDSSKVWHKITGAAKAHGIKVNEEKGMPTKTEKRAADVDSYEEVMNAVNVALPKNMYVCSTYPDYVIACDWSSASKGYVKIPYTYEDGDVELGEQETVEVDWVPSERSKTAIAALRSAAVAAETRTEPVAEPVAAAAVASVVEAPVVADPAPVTPEAVAQPTAEEIAAAEVVAAEEERSRLAMRARAAIEMA